MPDDTTQESQPELTPEERQAQFLESLTKLNKMADDAMRKLDDGTAEVKVMQSGGTVVDKKVAELDEDERSFILQKVQRFLDPIHPGPLFFAALPSRNKLFFGKYPVQQDIMDVKKKSGAVPGEQVTEYQAEMSIVGELMQCTIGWVPLNSKRAEWMRAHAAFENFEKWPAFSPIEWLGMRDPFLWDDEILPVWKQYVEWRNSVTPTREEMAFYYSLML